MVASVSSGLLFEGNDLLLLDLSAVIASLKFLHGERYCVPTPKGSIVVHYTSYTTSCAPDPAIMVLLSLHETDLPLWLYLSTHALGTGGTILVEPLQLRPSACNPYSQRALETSLHCH